MVERGDGVCSSIRFDFRGYNRVEIRLSDNPGLGGKSVQFTDDISFLV